MCYIITITLLTGYNLHSGSECNWLVGVACSYPTNSNHVCMCNTVWNIAVSVFREEYIPLSEWKIKYAPSASSEIDLGQLVTWYYPLPCSWYRKTKIKNAVSAFSKINTSLIKNALSAFSIIILKTEVPKSCSTTRVFKCTDFDSVASSHYILARKAIDTAERNRIITDQMCWESKWKCHVCIFNINDVQV